MFLVLRLVKTGKKECVDEKSVTGPARVGETVKIDESGMEGVILAKGAKKKMEEEVSKSSPKPIKKKGRPVKTKDLADKVRDPIFGGATVILHLLSFHTVLLLTDRVGSFGRSSPSGR